MRRVLDTLYSAAAGVAALCLLAILLLVAAQVGARTLDVLLVAAGLTPTRFVVPSLAEIAGFLLAGATFLALADTLAKNVHIRVDLVTARLPAGLRQGVDGVVALVGAAVAGFGAYATGALALKSYSFDDVSYGMVAVPLALPQATLALGLVILTIALVDEAVLAFTGRDRIAGSGGGV
ncbi:TRAP transporter small permease [Aurantimonas endophytica]|uniref:TRAP transporter small permease protein n=1 Tax=Aurantimonas endophytica TaxID=1522175 RepID=A0A7W6HIC7_9HYPH|nr:TRAP transporter small permease subunit [Aurantimonas endophytica]MBB4005491.1 TRAP-type C4-dicarboxylate transport system permease small subunit [Aurantimonas endophytica]MCO6405854.1 TRAP transporter small permease subunit [Aurantimonas endophytica]